MEFIWINHELRKQKSRLNQTKWRFYYLHRTTNDNRNSNRISFFIFIFTIKMKFQLFTSNHIWFLWLCIACKWIVVFVGLRLLGMYTPKLLFAPFMALAHLHIIWSAHIFAMLLHNKQRIFLYGNLRSLNW